MKGPQDSLEKEIDKRAIQRGYMTESLLEEIRELLKRYLGHGLSKAELARIEVLVNAKNSAVLQMQIDGQYVYFSHLFC